MAWNPPNNLVQGISALFEYLFTSAEKRAEVLDPSKTEVVRNAVGSFRADENTGSVVAQVQRGWESVWTAGYWAMLKEIEDKLNDREMPRGFDDSPADYGLAGGGPPLTKDDFTTRLRRYRYEVWGGGYNWLQSNVRSAADVWEYVEGTILKKAYPKEILNEEEKILVVTHSMGGMVARTMFTDKARTKKTILGAVHTVKDNQLGRVTQGDYMANIQEADCPGDSTVPKTSAEDQRKASLGCFIHSEGTPKSKRNGYEHSQCFANKMMKWSVVYSVARIVLETLGKK
jgi:hypothetical protein